MLKETFTALTAKYTDNFQLINKLWDEIRLMYSDSSRHYHTLLHLDNLLLNLNAIKKEIEDWEVVLFAAFYHDIVYQSTGDKNEEQSGALANLRLTELSFPENRISKCISIILATKTHAKTGDNDTDYFTDADLAILGQDGDMYSQYTQQVRKEYSIYPDLIYNPGRKKVLNHFLKMNPIYKTIYFFDRFEKQAKENMSREASIL